MVGPSGGFLNNRNHRRNIKLGLGPQSSGLHSQVERLVPRIAEANGNGLLGQYSLLQDELEMSRGVGAGGGAPDAIGGGDDHIGDGQLILGVSVALDHRAFNGHQLALGDQAQPVGAQEQEKADGGGGSKCDDRPDNFLFGHAIVGRATWTARASIIQLFDCVVVQKGPQDD